MLSPQIAQLLIHTITVEPPSTTAASGDKTFGASVAVKARVQHDVRNVRDSAGREVVSQTFIIASPTDVDGNAVAFGPSDRITLPAGFTPARPPILSIARLDDHAGLHHWEIRA